MTISSMKVIKTNFLILGSIGIQPQNVAKAFQQSIIDFVNDASGSVTTIKVVVFEEKHVSTFRKNIVMDQGKTLKHSKHKHFESASQCLNTSQSSPVIFHKTMEQKILVKHFIFNKEHSCTKPSDSCKYREIK